MPNHLHLIKPRQIGQHEAVLSNALNQQFDSPLQKQQVEFLDVSERQLKTLHEVIIVYQPKSTSK